MKPSSDPTANHRDVARAGFIVIGALLTAGIVLLLATIAVGAALLSCGRARAEPIAPAAIHVIDGDTIAVGKVHYRLVGFDTPETTRRAKCRAERDLGAAATQRLRLIVSKGGLDLSEVPCSCAPGTAGTFKCNYGRRCGVLTQGGRDVGDTLMAEGLARPYPFDWRAPPAHPDWCGAP